jgi:hypothetical protein
MQPVQESWGRLTGLHNIPGSWYLRGEWRRDLRRVASTCCWFLCEVLPNPEQEERHGPHPAAHGSHATAERWTAPAFGCGPAWPAHRACAHRRLVACRL